MRFERSDVVCTEGDGGTRIPVAFTFSGRQLPVEDVIDRWHEGGTPGRPPVSYFKVSTTGGGMYILRYAVIFDAWAAVPCAKGE